MFKFLKSVYICSVCVNACMQVFKKMYNELLLYCEVLQKALLQTSSGSGGGSRGSLFYWYKLM